MTQIPKLKTLNHSRRCNFCICGIPESIRDIYDVAHSLMLNALPNADAYHLEIDRIHRVLSIPKPDGLPRDILVNPHFYNTKNAIMRYARENPNLKYKGFQYQIFTDIAPITIQKRKALKPLLLPLVSHNMPYHWAYPFRLSFTFEGKNYPFSIISGGEQLLMELGLISSSTTTQGIVLIHYLNSGPISRTQY